MRPLNYIFLLIALLLIPEPLFAQQIYQVEGTIVDSTTNQPVPFAQVALYKPDGTAPVTGTVTEENGQFLLKIKEGVYDLAVIYVGYEDKRLEDINVNRPKKNIGAISIVPAAKQLREVVVESEAVPQAIATDLEGLTIRPEQTISNVGGNLLDILRNTPSVTVGQDGSISIRGSRSTNVLIDGRNSALATDLEQIPASAIKSIKIVNNPNAKYDAEGAGGVINIQLKQGSKLGTTAKAEVTIGTRYRLNSSLRISQNTEKLNLFGGYSFRRWPRVGTSETYRNTFDNNQSLIQFEDSERKDLEHTFTYGADYVIGKSKFSYEGAFNMEDEQDTEVTFSRLFNPISDKLLLQYTRVNVETEDNLTLDNALIYSYLFDNPDQSLRASVSYSFRDQLENQNVDVFSRLSPVGERPSGLERSVNDEMRKTAIVQLDYVQPLGTGKLETGYKSTFRSFDNDYTYEIFNQDTELWVNQEHVSNRFLYQDQVHALYSIYSLQLGQFEVSGGLRMEQTLVNTKLYTTGEENEQNYLNLFPSTQALYHLNDKQSVKFTYSRRIDRPGGWRLNPFPDISDSLNIRLGNQNLKPEYINSFELGYMMKLNKADFTSTIFYRHVDGQVDYVVRLENGISYRQPTNLNSSISYGVEFINSTRLFEWWNFDASASIFRTEVDGTNLDEDYANDGFSWNARLNTDFRLPYDIRYQITGNYEAPEIEAQGRDFSRYYVDMSLLRKFMDEKLSLSLSLRDVFNTRQFAGENSGKNFYQRFERKRESRIFLVNIGYTF